eukprot:376572-Prorocentrum_minimum.AAC.1
MLPVDVQHVLGEGGVHLVVRAVQNEPQQVEAGQQRRRQRDVLLRGTARVVPARGGKGVNGRRKGG